MRVALTALDAAGGTRDDVLVSLDEAATVHDVARALRDALARGSDDGTDEQPLAIVIRHPRFSQRAAAASGGAAAPPEASKEAPSRLTGNGAGEVMTLWVDGRPLGAQLPAGRALRDGMVVALGPRSAGATGLAEPTGVVEVRVSGGPAAGPVHRLGLGRFEVGGDRACAVALADPAVPPRAATLTVGPAGATVEPAPGLALRLDGSAVTAASPWPYGGVLAVGDTLLTLQFPEEADASLTPTDDGGLAYNRPPRLDSGSRGRRLAVPEEPAKGEGPRFSLMATALPAVAGVAMALLFRQPMYLAMALLSPVTMLANYLSDRRSGQKRHGSAMKQYQRARPRSCTARGTCPSWCWRRGARRPGSGGGRAGCPMPGRATARTASRWSVRTPRPFPAGSPSWSTRSPGAGAIAARSVWTAAPASRACCWCSTAPGRCGACPACRRCSRRGRRWASTRSVSTTTSACFQRSAARWPPGWGTSRRGCACAAVASTKAARSSPTRWGPPGASGWPGRSRPSATSAARTPRACCRTAPACSTCSACRTPTPSRSRPPGRGRGARRSHRSATPPTARSSWTSAATARTRWSPVPPVRASRSCCRP